MLKRGIKITLLSALVVLIGASVSFAQLYGESVDFGDLSDSRDMTVLGGDWAGFSISWNISETSAGSGTWDYSYTVMNGKDISNFILELTNPTLAGDITNFEVNGSPDSFSGPQDWDKSGNVTLPANIYGMKVSTDDLNPVTYSFTIDADPVWGDFHAKDGKDGGTDVVAYNWGLTNHSSSNTDDFIVRPNGGSNPPVVPEPISSTLFIVGAATMGFRRYRKNRKLS